MIHTTDEKHRAAREFRAALRALLVDFVKDHEDAKTAWAIIEELDEEVLQGLEPLWPQRR